MAAHRGFSIHRRAGFYHHVREKQGFDKPRRIEDIPSEIESLILQHPQVEQACVVGTPNPVLGESICACVIPRGEPKISLTGDSRLLEGESGQAQTAG